MKNIESQVDSIESLKNKTTFNVYFLDCHENPCGFSRNDEVKMPFDSIDLDLQVWASCYATHTTP